MTAGSRPGGRVSFLLRGKKVTKETRPAAPACGFPRSRPPARPAVNARSWVWGTKLAATSPGGSALAPTLEQRDRTPPVWQS
jgi:hypothetical protein